MLRVYGIEILQRRGMGSFMKVEYLKVMGHIRKNECPFCSSAIEYRDTAYQGKDEE